jgi:hypothetical protein
MASAADFSAFSDSFTLSDYSPKKLSGFFEKVRTKLMLDHGRFIP